MSQEQTTELAVIDPPAELQAQAAQSLLQPFTVETLVERVKLVKEAMQRCMVEGQHYGTVPGTKKPSLWKPGAELLGVLFQLGQRYRVQERLLPNDHILYTITCTQFYRPTGAEISEGVGACTTMEYKYRVQTEPKVLDKGRTIAAKYTPYDFYNTCLKMGAKRALIATTINASGVSEIFIQDTEDNPELYRNQEPQPARRPHGNTPTETAMATSQRHGRQERLRGWRASLSVRGQMIITVGAPTWPRSTGPRFRPPTRLRESTYSGWPVKSSRRSWSPVLSPAKHTSSRSRRRPR